MTADLNSYQYLMQSTPGGCLLLQDGVVLLANPEGAETLGVPSDRLVGQPLGEFFIPRFAQLYAEAVSRAQSEGGHRTHRATVRMVTDLAPVELTLRRLRPNPPARSLPDAVGRTVAPDDRSALVVVGVRSMEAEYRLSAQAAGALTHDVATGLPDHFHVLTQLHHRLRSSSPKGTALLLVWLDNLHGITETHGARSVNRVMRQVGERLQQRLRAPDLVGRFDEAGFVVLMSSNADIADLQSIAARLRAEAAFPLELDRGLVSFTSSVVVGSIATPKVSIERVLAALDAAADRTAAGSGNRTDLLTI